MKTVFILFGAPLLLFGFGALQYDSLRTVTLPAIVCGGILLSVGLFSEKD